MATTIRDLLVSLGVDIDSNAHSDVDRLDGSLGDLKSQMQGAVVVAAALGAGLLALVHSAAAAGDAVDKGSTAAAITSEEYQQLAFIASQTGTTVEVATKAMGKQTTALGQLRDGTGAAGEALRGLGLEYDTLAELDPMSQFMATADAISQATTQQEMLQAATKVYGEDMAQQLLPMLQAGRDGLQDMADQAVELGLVMSQDQVDAAVEFTDAWDQVKRMVLGAKNAIGIALMPTLTDALVRVRDWYALNREVVQVKMQSWLDAFRSGVESVSRVLRAADTVVRRTLGSWRPVLVAVAAAAATLAAIVAALAAAKLWGSITAVITAVGAVGAAAFAKIVAAVVAVVAVLALLYLAIDDLIVYLDGGDSALGRFLDTHREADTLLGSVARTVLALGGMLQQLAVVTQQLGAAWWQVFQVTMLPLIQLVGAALLWLGEKGFGWVAWWLDNVTIPAIQAAGDLLGWLANMISGTVQPALDNSVGRLQQLLDLASRVTGLELGIGGGGAPASVGPGAAQAAAGAFAPGPGEVLGPTGSLAAAGAFSGGGGSTVSVGGNSYEINGVGWTRDDVLDLVNEAERERARQTSAALEGAEV